MALTTPDFLHDKPFDAIVLRRVLAEYGIVQPGVIGQNDLAVVQHAGAANMSVDIGAGVGWVQGTTVARQGFYHAYNDATYNLAIANNTSGNPRIDQIILRLYDAFDGGAATDNFAFEVAQGAPTGGATLDNRSGAAALPASCIRIGDVLVPNGAASIVTANIRDRRPLSRGALFRQIKTNGSPTTAATSPGTAIDASLFQIRIECTGNPIRFTLQTAISNNTANASNLSGLFMDGSAIDGISALSAATTGTAGTTVNMVWEYITTPTAGSHLFNPYFYVTSGTGTILGTAANPCVFMAEELVGRTASMINGQT